VIKAVLVDAGGVLFNNVTEDSSFFERVGARYGVGGETIRAAYAAAEPVFERGGATAVDTIEAILSERGIDAGDGFRANVEGLYVSCVEPNRAVFDWLRRRPGAETLGVYLANNEARDWDYAKQRAFGHFDLFDETFSSWKVGRVKPTRAYFGAVLHARGLAPSDALLVDDDAGCVAAAIGLGLRAVRFDAALGPPELW
jgi:putative hydrolase of the HAD superfamily